jgi:glucosamine--fructose-6-phosphate aminotransferase (isomerizing)
MCGIVGYIGGSQAVPILLEGLKKLEYRGYDSAGVAVCGSRILVRKYRGRLSVLEEHLNSDKLQGTTGIGHTRWATHGEPSDNNAHPHVNKAGDIAVVHNGIIENYMQIKEFLIGKGCSFASETDTEVLAHYIDYFYDGDLTEAVRKVLHEIRGSYAFAVISGREPDRIVCVRKENPLVIGAGDGENYIASDIPAILSRTREIYLLDENELAVVKRDKIICYDQSGNITKKDRFEVNWDVSAAEKGGYEHFMLKEIHEQPKAVRDTMYARVSSDEPGVKLDKITMTKQELDRIKRIYIIACGTAYHAGMVAKQALEHMTGIPVEVAIASEFRYVCPTVDKDSLTIVISQSGETLDTLMALKEVRKKGSGIFSIVNVVGSTIARESDDVLYTRAGPEIAVASTKAYTSQLTAIYELALYFACLKGSMPETEIERIKSEMLELPDKIERILQKKEDMLGFAKQHAPVEDVFYIGRGLDYALALEGSLKLKEISYIHSEAYPAGELKHGTIALIVPGTVVIAIVTQDMLLEKMISNIR